MNQLKLGIQAEKEHKDTISFIRDRINKGKPITNQQIYERIASDHLREDKNYYKKLKKAGL